MKTQEVVSPRQLYVRALPKNLASSDHKIFAPWEQVEISAASIEVLHDAQAFGSGPLRHRGRYVTESFVSPEHETTWYRKRRHWRASVERICQRRTPIEQPALWITDNWSCNYFHWMCDALARLEVASLSRDLSDLTLLLPYKYKRYPFIRESLAAFGLREIRFLRRFERAECRELILPLHLAYTGNYHHDIIERMHVRYTHFLRLGDARASNAVSKYGERVYISRRVATRRRVENEDAILPTLREHGFQIMIAEEHDWETQMRIAAGAKYLVSNHGAGLTNMLMMTAGGKVLEIRDAIDPTPNCYFSLASAVRLDYYYLLAHRTNPDETVHSGNMVVDPEKLKHGSERNGWSVIPTETEAGATAYPLNTVVSSPREHAQGHVDFTSRVA